MNSKEFFREVYKKNIWNDPDSSSGTGSNLKETENIRNMIPDLLKEFRILSFLDIPCGDFYWMKEIQPELRKSLKSYTGGDIVDEIIIANNQKYSDKLFKFQRMDLTKSQLPESDLLFCRDCLVHFSYSEILKALINIKRSKSKYLLTTLFPGRKNRNIRTGNWRPLDLQKFPFYLPAPLRLYSENCTEFDGAYHDKSLGLWNVSKIRLHRFRFCLFLVFAYEIIMKLFRQFSLD